MQQASIVSDIEKRLEAPAATIIKTAEELLRVLISLNDNMTDRTGGYLSITAKVADELLLCSRIGAIPHQDDANPKFKTKARKYCMFAQEKCMRTIANAFTNGHLSSWQSRNQDADMWGGAVMCDEFAVGFSGLPELADEAFSLALSVHFGWMDIGRADAIAGHSKNPFFKPLLVAWREAGHAVPIPIK